jgi:hypothetical protein
VFDFARDPGFKNVVIEIACALWDLLLRKRCKFLDVWLQFWTDEMKDSGIVKKD